MVGVLEISLAKFGAIFSRAAAMRYICASISQA